MSAFRPGTKKLQKATFVFRIWLHNSSQNNHMNQVNLFDAKSSLSSLVARAVAGEEIVIAKHGKPMVKLVPVSSGGRKPGSAKGKVRIAKDFDKLPAGFKPYA